MKLNVLQTSYPSYAVWRDPRLAHWSMQERVRIKLITGLYRVLATSKISWTSK
jgi:hypothetical protein